MAAIRRLGRCSGSRSGLRTRRTVPLMGLPKELADVDDTPVVVGKPVELS